jgi:hypothetical protein
MYKRVTTPVEGKVIRFAPGRNREPASSIWKVWAEGSDVYALSRRLGGSLKISVHESGQIHLRKAAKQKQDLAPLIQIGSGPWLHAFELRFLLSDGALVPIDERKSLRHKTARLVSVPDGFALYANLIIGPAGSPLDFPLPAEFLPAAQTLWRTRLRNGRVAVVLGRMLVLDEENRAHIKYLREELGLTANVTTMPDKRYLELHDVHWSAGGNVILVVPLGDEAFRSEQELPQSGAVPQPTRTFHYQSVHATVELTAPAPGGRRVAIIELPEVNKQVELVKGQPTTVELGLLTMRVEPDNLIPGGKFIVPPRNFANNPNIGGASFRDWQNEIHAKFDGTQFLAEVRKTSGALQNKNLATPIGRLGDGEEIVIAIPSDTITLSATIDVPSTSAQFLGRFTWRDRR